MPPRFLHDWLLKIWYGSKKPPLFLRAIAYLYARVKPRKKAKRQHQYGAMIIVVGNITIGGAGKTPLVMALVEYIQASGRTVGVLSRGYGGRVSGPVVVDVDSQAEEVGDEPLLIRRRTDVPVVVSRQRVAGLELLLSRHDLDVVIADDGLQHHLLPRDMEICLVDGRRGLGNGYLLPAGPLRESPETLARVDRVLYKERQAERLPLADLMTTRLVSAVSLATPDNSQPLTAFSGQRVAAVAAIANPESFFALLEQAGIEVIRFSFPDHHRFSPADIAGIDAHLPILMTAKDAMKWGPWRLHQAWIVPLVVDIPATFWDWFETRMRSLEEARET